MNTENIVVKAAKVVGKKMDVFAFTDKKHPIAQGVYHSNGYAYATNQHILLKSKIAYLPENNGEIVDRKGGFIDGAYLSAESVIRSALAQEGENPVTMLPSKELLKSAKKVARLGKKVRATPYIPINGAIFDATLVELMLKAIACENLDNVRTVKQREHHMLVATNDEGAVCILMSLYLGAIDYDGEPLAHICNYEDLLTVENSERSRIVEEYEELVNEFITMSKQ